MIRIKLWWKSTPLTGVDGAIGVNSQEGVVSGCYMEERFFLVWKEGVRLPELIQVVYSYLKALLKMPCKFFKIYLEEKTKFRLNSNYLYKMIFSNAMQEKELINIFEKLPLVEITVWFKKVHLLCLFFNLSKNAPRFRVPPHISKEKKVHLPF